MGIVKNCEKGRLNTTGGDLNFTLNLWTTEPHAHFLCNIHILLSHWTFKNIYGFDGNDSDLTRPRIIHGFIVMGLENGKNRFEKFLHFGKSVHWYTRIISYTTCTRSLLCCRAVGRVRRYTTQCAPRPTI